MSVSPNPADDRPATKLLNLTPHPIRIYSPDTPDRIDDIQQGLIATIPPSGELARLSEFDPSGRPVEPTPFAIDGTHVGIPVRARVFTDVDGLPPIRLNVCLIVPLITALAELAEGHRPDLLVPYDQVRNADGAVVGCRAFARPC